MRIIVWVFAVLGALFLLFIVAVFGVGFVGAKKGFELAKGAAAFADETIAAYGVDWDEAVLEARAAPELHSELANNPQALDQLSLVMDVQAGPFVSAEPSACENFSYTATAAVGEIFTAECSARGVVANGAAKFETSVVYRRKEWRLLGFTAYVTPSAPGESPTSTLVSYEAVSPSELRPAGLRSTIGGRSIVFSPANRSIGFEVSRPASYGIGVHAQSTAKFIGDEP